LSIAQLPTPLEEMPRLTAALGGPRLLVKRDDLTGLALGGNKVRHLEFRVADALAQGCDSFVAVNVAQSNHARLHAAVAARYGLKMYHLRPGPIEAPVQGNLLLDTLFGSTIIPLGESSGEQRRARLEDFLAELRARGEKPYPVANSLRSSQMGGLAFVNAGLELWQQVQERRLKPDHLFLVAGCSAAGLALVGKWLGLPWRVHAVSVGEGHDHVWRYIDDVARGVAELLDLAYPLTRADVDIHDEYVGPGYGQVTEAGVEAIRLAARQEALVLDPVYTGKALSGLIGQLRRGALAADETAIFIHTGGIPITFAYSEQILARL
jgi:1-aminocyclopropane-1-carboxylate deaminase/D-cysteine desulfhydrase-like pyridoxal-dependent ACC family enzyme